MLAIESTIRIKKTRSNKENNQKGYSSWCSEPPSLSRLFDVVKAHIAHGGGGPSPDVLRALVGAVTQEHLHDLQFAVEAAAVQRSPIVVALCHVKDDDRAE